MKTLTNTYLTNNIDIDNLILQMLEKEDKYPILDVIANLAFGRDELELLYINVLKHYADEKVLKVLMGYRDSLITQICIKHKAFIPILNGCLSDIESADPSPYEYLLYRHNLLNSNPKLSEEKELTIPYETNKNAYNLLKSENPAKIRITFDNQKIATLRRLDSHMTNVSDYVLEYINPHYISRLVEFLTKHLLRSYLGSSHIYILIDATLQILNYGVSRAYILGDELRHQVMNTETAIEYYIEQFPDYAL